MELAELLLERGANPNSQLKQWRPPFVRLARGQDNTLATGATPLLRAAHASDVAAVKLLLAHKALVDLPNASGITPLMAAAGVGVSQNTSRAKKKTEAASIEVARLLIEAGADVNRVTHDPRRIRTDPLVREAMYGFIFQMAFDYAYLPPSGRTALHGAAQKGWNDMVRLLVENGAEVQPVDASGRTPRNMAMGNYELAITEAQPGSARGNGGAARGVLSAGRRLRSERWLRPRLRIVRGSARRITAQPDRAPRLRRRSERNQSAASPIKMTPTKIINQ